MEKNNSNSNVLQRNDNCSLTSIDSFCSELTQSSVSPGAFSENLQHLKCSNVPNSINVKNSTDVIIGPVIQYYGPVTIHQRQDSTNNQKVLFRNETVSTNNLINTVEVDQVKKFKEVTLCKKQVLRFVGIAILSAICLTVTYFVVINVKSDPWSNYGDDDDDPDIVIEGGHRIFSKSTWGGADATGEIEKLELPLRFFVICHTTGSSANTFQGCSRKMQNIQSYHVNTLNRPDIIYNFVICGDGNIYVGRGWNKSCGRIDNGIQIAFVGNYVYVDLSSNIIKAAQNLIDYGVKTHKLSSDYVLVGQNQTMDTESPGRNVYKVIKEWPHFFNGSILNGELVP